MVSKFLISEGVQIGGEIPNKWKEVVVKLKKAVGGLKYINKYITYSPKKNEFYIYRKEWANGK